MRLFKRKIEIRVEYVMRRGRLSKWVTATPLPKKKNIYRILLSRDEYIDVEVKL